MSAYEKTMSLRDIKTSEKRSVSKSQVIQTDDRLGYINRNVYSFEANGTIFPLQTLEVYDAKSEENLLFYKAGTILITLY